MRDYFNGSLTMGKEKFIEKISILSSIIYTIADNLLLLKLRSLPNSMTDTLQSIHTSAKRFFSGTLLSRLSGMLRDVALAFFFGTQPALAAFMLAFRLSHLLRRLFGEGALQSAFIPAFESLRHQQAERAFLFFKDLTWTLTLFLILLIGAGEIGLGLCLYLLELNDSYRQILILTALMLPSLLFICLYGLNASLLQCEKYYFIPSVAPVAFNAIWILVLPFLYALPINQAMQGLALAVVGACFCQWFFTYPLTKNVLNKTLLTQPMSPPTFLSLDVKLILKPLSLGIIGVAASQINNTVDMVFARYAQSDGPALLWYAIRLQQLPLALFGIALAGAILPPLARARKTQQWENYHHFFQDALIRTWNFMLPLTLFLFVAGDACVNLLYGHGEFSAQSVEETTLCLAGYSMGLIPTALVLILAPACYAQQAYHLPAFASIGSMVLNLLLNAFFIFGLGWGALSVSLATSFSAWINVLFLGVVLSNSHSLNLATLFKSNFIYTLLAIFGCLSVLTFRYYFYFSSFNHFYLVLQGWENQLKMIGFLSLFFSLPYCIYFCLNHIKNRFLNDSVINRSNLL
jgi:putative peptidoglycan lipid II flippase